MRLTEHPNAEVAASPEEQAGAVEVPEALAEVGLRATHSTVGARHVVGTEKVADTGMVDTGMGVVTEITTDMTPEELFQLLQVRESW